MLAKRLQIAKFAGVRWNSGLSVARFNNETTSVMLNGQEITFNNVFLRDSCTGPKSKDYSSSQKLFNTGDISRNLKIEKKPFINKEGLLEITWEDATGSTISFYSKDFLLKHSTLENSLKSKMFPQDQTYWTNETYKPTKVTYKNYFESGFDEIVYNLNKYGLCFITDIPQPKETKMSEDNWQAWPVASLANKFGYIKKTFYGTLFDVKNEKGAKNIANTQTFLPLHMDLLYYESPPGLQFLHFIHNSTEGGENIFSDSFAAALYVKEKDPQAYEALKKIPITYNYDNAGEYYYYVIPVVVEDELTGNIKHINYSPPFQGPFEKGIIGNDPLFKDFLRGLQLFEDFINNPKNQYIIKNSEGSAVVFDNRRVLHSRNEFSDSNGGDRWLMGCYVDGDSYRSKLRMLYRKRKLDV